MKNLKFTIALLFTIITFISCNDDQSDLVSRIDFAQQLKKECMQDNCSDAVLCHYQNGEYHYFIFEWEGFYYDFAWIENYPPDQYYSSNIAMDLEEAQDICVWIIIINTMIDFLKDIFIIWAVCYIISQLVDLAAFIAEYIKSKL